MIKSKFTSYAYGIWHTICADQIASCWVVLHTGGSDYDWAAYGVGITGKALDSYARIKSTP